MTHVDDEIETSAMIVAPHQETPKPEHYVVISISMYNDDREAATAKVAALKARGFTQMSMSRLIRIAIERVNVDDLERDMRTAGIKR